MVAILATTDVPFLDLAANVPALAQKIADQLKPAFIQLGLELAQFNVENVSLPDELTKVLDQRIGMGMVGDVGRYTQYAAAESLDLAAANTGGGAGVGMGLGAGAAVAQVLATSLKASATTPAAAPAASGPAAGAGSPAAPAAADTKFCIDCGKPIPVRSHYCPDCGQIQ
jgi:membrane protease subunit (stomatin/prohibitin family)